ncbi:MAG: T9SS type A sorting domain-containing protein [Chitinophagaceae bacterium]|jgi:hypothetical protein
MKKLLLAFALFALQSANAQSIGSTYFVKVQTGQTYYPLNDGTSISSGCMWDDENFKIPLGFSAKVGDKIVTDFSFCSGLISLSSDTSGIIDAIFPFSGTDLEDRGWLSGVPVSPLRYRIDGAAPNRIFKFEVSNAGFFDEEIKHKSLQDSVNFQVWVYETSSILEIRLGSFKISHPEDYFYLMGNTPLVGYLKDYDADAGTLGKLYSLKGSPSEPIVDSISSVSDPINVFSKMPSAGTVYRFIPQSVAVYVGEVDISNHFKVYPTQVNQLLTVEQNSTVNAKAQIMSANGQLIQAAVSLTNGKNNIDVSALASGVYMLQLSTEEGNAVYKFVKQ